VCLWLTLHMVAQVGPSIRTAHEIMKRVKPTDTTTVESLSAGFNWDQTQDREAGPGGGA